MASKQSTVDYILDQLLSINNIKSRKMFGEYALYCNGKVVALICNDKLYVKITAEGKCFVADSYCEGYAYKGARVSMLISEDKIDDSEWLSQLILITADNLPLPKNN
ncbi:MAG: TfoX/Sxy family protein [Candidatus Falkowbacteria bacterium]